jgi:hypothetical protein
VTPRAPIALTPAAWVLHKLLSHARADGSDKAALPVVYMARECEVEPCELPALVAELQRHGSIELDLKTGEWNDEDAVWGFNVLVPMRGFRKRIEDLMSTAEVACAAIPGKGTGLDW